jgi:hypothetical protein
MFPSRKAELGQNTYFGAAAAAVSPRYIGSTKPFTKQFSSRPIYMHEMKEAPAASNVKSRAA